MMRPSSVKQYWNKFKTGKKKGLWLSIFGWLVSFGWSQEVTAQQIPLFQITENSRKGFIDANGKVIIKPVFREAGEFSEGLASARLNGTYGFIDQTGKFIIAPQYDYATEFSEGLAIVYKNGRPFYINRQGKQVFNCPYAKVNAFKNGRAIVQTNFNKTGVIDKQGRLIIDTVYALLNTVDNGLAIVEGLNHNHENYKKRKPEVGIIDSTGRFIVPFGKFDEFQGMKNSYFKATIPPEPWDSIDGSTRQTVLLNKDGKIILAKDHKAGIYLSGFPNSGLISVFLENKLKPTLNPDGSTADRDYQGYMNLKGEIVINSTGFRSVEDFSFNRAFVKDHDRKVSIITTNGKIIADKAFDDVLGSGYKNGVAFVSVDYKWGIIDTNANFLVKPTFDGIAGGGLIGEYFFFEQHMENDTMGGSRLIGVASANGKVLVPPIMEQVSYKGFRDGLLVCLVKNKLTYLNKEGKIVWQETKNRPAKNLNIDYMNRGSYYAYSKPDKKDLGGFGGSNNFPQKLTGKHKVPKNILNVAVLVTEKDTLYGGYAGMKVIVANSTKKEIKFNAQDSRLYMKVQALKPDGQWHDIEYLPSSWCGNSYHKLALNSKSYWSFVTPVYEGEVKTKFRIALNYIDKTSKPDEYGEQKELTIYSNEFEGSVNPGQFWRKPEYYPNGIMDPYNN